MPSASPLAPIDPSSVTSEESLEEKEKSAPWIMRKLAGSMTGRIVMSSYESLRAAGTTVVCLSPWGDSSPILLPCIRFRDLAVHAVIAATGGAAAVAAPVMGPISDVVVGTFGDSLLVEIALKSGFEATTKVANDLVIEHTIKHAIPSPSGRLETTGVKTLLVTLKYKHTVEDASLGFYRSSVHEDASLFASVKDYLATEKGWFSPYLFASGRRPIIPRTMTPDFVFCHGPFLTGDYALGTRLLDESASAIFLCDAVPPVELPADNSKTENPPEEKHSLLHVPSLPVLSKYLPQPRSRTPSPEPCLAPIPHPIQPRRLVVILLGIKPHRKVWTSSARPGESAIQYTLLNGSPSVILPAIPGSPLVAWNTLTLEKLHELELPDAEDQGGDKFKGVIDVFCEYLELCIDWDRVVLEQNEVVQSEQHADLSARITSENIISGDNDKRQALRNAITLLLLSAVCSKDSKQVTKEVDVERAGIVVFRIP